MKHPIVFAAFLAVAAAAAVVVQRCG